jgi:hypothetical protein
MDADNRGFLLVLSRNAYFTAGCGRMVVMLLGRVAAAAAASSMGSHATSSLATSTASPSPGNPAGAVARHVAWLATTVAVDDNPHINALCEALLVVFRQVIARTTVLHIIRICLMNGHHVP